MKYTLINDSINQDAIDIERPVKIDWSRFWQPYDQVNLEIESSSGFKKQLHLFNKTGIKIDLHELAQRDFVIIKINWMKSGEKISSEELNFTTASFGIQTAQWITRLDNPLFKDKDFYDFLPNPIFEKTIWIEPLEEIDCCYIDIACLGYYVASLNGCKLGDFELNSDVTDYRQRIYFDSYEVRNLLKKGENVLRIECGNGWGNPAPIQMIKKYNFRRILTSETPRIAVNIDMIAGTRIVANYKSNLDWRSGYGQIDFNNIYIGEVIDKRRKIKMTGKTVAVPCPTKELRPSFIQKNKVNRHFTDYSIVEEKDNSFVIDFNRIITGFFGMNVSSGVSMLTIEYGEHYLNNEVDPSSTIPGIFGENSFIGQGNDEVIQFDQLIKNDKPTKFINQFSYHTFRYVKVTGANLNQLSEIKAYSVHTALEVTAKFNSNDSELSDLWAAAIETKQNNVHSYFEDCARERLCYGGDNAALAESQLYIFKSEAMIKKIWEDFSFEQTPAGGITQTAPFVGIRSNGPSDQAGALGWQKVITELPIVLDKYCINSELNNAEKKTLIKYANYLLSFSYDYIKECCLGDWGALHSVFVGGRETPKDRVGCGALMYLINLRDIHKIMESCGNNILSRKLKQQIISVREMIISEFYHDGVLGEGSQSIYAYALTAKLFEGQMKKKTEDEFVAKVINDGYLTTGFWGMHMTYQYLQALGRDDLILKWLQRREEPSYLNMLKQGNHTLNEYFDLNRGSSNHAMFSSYSTWFINRLLGLQIDSFEKFHFAPYLGHSVKILEGEIDGYGKVFIKNLKGIFDITLKINPNKEFSIDYLMIENQNYSIVSQIREYGEINLKLEKQK